MNAEKAAELVNIIRPDIAVPTHYGSVVGRPGDGRLFKELVDEDIIVPLLIRHQVEPAEKPAEETADETPVDAETPVEAPVEEPAPDETAGYEEPVAEEVPAEEAPVETDIYEEEEQY